MEWSAAILLGFLGSLHCVGMCGPLALAVPIRTRSNSTRFAAALLYNSGRILSYAIMGALFGLMGWSLSLAGLQRYLTIGMGLLLIFYVIYNYTSFPRINIFPAGYNPAQWVQRQLSKLIRKSSLGNVTLIGFLNGLLPCGLVYMAIAGAVSSGNWMDGALFMAVFGLGTLPAMLSIMLLGKYLNASTSYELRKAVPYALLVLGSLFLIRGMNLGIPYLSPKISYELNTVEGCH